MSTSSAESPSPRPRSAMPTVGPSASDASSTRPTTAATSLATQTACRSSKESTCSLYRRCQGVPTDSAGRRRDARRPRPNLRTSSTGISRSRGGNEPPDAHRGGSARRDDHHAHGLLPEGAAGRRMPVVSLRDAQQFRRQLPFMDAREHTRLLGDHRSTACRCRSGRLLDFARSPHLAPRGRGARSAHGAGTPARARRSRHDLEPAQFHHILNTFPLVPRAERDAALQPFAI